MRAKRLILSIAVLCISLCSLAASAQTITVSGEVRDKNETLPGVSIILKGTSTGTMSDIDGKYSITVKKGDILVFSYIGYIKQEIKVTAPKLDVVLVEDNKSLDEVVVVGYGSSQKKDITGSLAGAVSGFKINNSSDKYYGNPGTIYIRGSSSSGSSNESLARLFFNNTESYKTFTSNQFKDVSSDPLSTFSIDVDKASYSNMRRFLNNGEMPPADAIRVEELINYFSYNYEKPEGNAPVNFNTEVGECHWDKKNRLVKIGLKAREIADENLPPANLVFLIDVSGSMSRDSRIGLVKSSMNLLIDQMRPQDRVAIVTYASGTKVNLESTSGNDKQKIRDVLNGLIARGATSGGDGIQLAYKTAEANFKEGANNRIVLCTDGDFNVGISSPDELKKFIEQKRKSGVFLSVLGYGMGNYKDDRMQSLAEAGNGNHAYINDMQEANKVLVTEFGGTMYTIAKDVKLQIEFNPLQVASYRLVGYESRLLENEDFNNDEKDAGDMGVGHTVTAFYEIVPVEGKKDKKKNKKKVDPLKYQVSTPTGSDELLTVKMRYKDPESEESKLVSAAVMDYGGDEVSDDFRFASAVAMYGKMLHSEKQYDVSELNKVITRASGAYGEDEDGYRREFVRLVKLTQSIAPKASTK